MEQKPALAAVREDTPGPLADLVFDRVLEAIYQGQLPPGSVINEVALAQEFGLPVHAVGVGEKAADLRPFGARDFARSLLGLG